MLAFSASFRLTRNMRTLLVYLSPLLIFFGSIPNLRAQTTPKPNVLLIVSDDQRFDDFGDFMPLTKERLVQQGISFAQAFVTTPSCCPSRASIFTGKYASRHEVRGNDYELHQPTLMQALHAAGYFTGLIGKYLNSWNGEPRPEFDYWVGHAGGQAEYENPLFNIQGTWKRESGYVTSVMESHAQEFLTAAQRSKKPFFLLFTPPSPHRPATPAPEDMAKYSALKAPTFANFMKIDPSGKPAWVKSTLAALPQERGSRDSFYRNQLRTLASLDRTIGAILDRLSNQKILDSTVVVFISDNGLMRGEFGLRGKDCAYEPAIHVPFVWRYPPVVSSIGTDDNHLVANIDIAPTLAELCGVTIPQTIDGRSLVPLFRAKDSGYPWRESLLIEGWSTKNGHAPFVALRTRTHKLIRTLDDQAELYELSTDPLEIVNRVQDPSLSALKQTLGAELDRLLLQVRGGISFDLPRGTKARPSNLRFSADDPE